MRLTVCIPIYNFYVAELVSGLGAQRRLLLAGCEILCVDDASREEFKAHNRPVCQAAGRYIELPENYGRSRIRNYLAAEASGEYLLFLDCDSRLVSGDFLQRYLEALERQPAEIVCGGRTYPAKWMGRSRQLRWKYGHLRESMTASQRALHPYSSFMSNNFVIHRALFTVTHFDERMRGYGHEDTIFGYHLMRSGVAIRHIENPIENGDVETNDEFLRKTEEGLRSLHAAIRLSGADPSLIASIGLTRVYDKCCGFGLERLLRAFYAICGVALRALLRSGYAPLLLFDVYKLARYARECR